MPRARPDRKDRWLQLRGTEPRFTNEQLERLRAICPSPYFANSLRFVAHFARARRAAGEPSNAALRATYDELARMAGELAVAVARLSFNASVRLNECDEAAGRDGEVRDGMLNLLVDFLDTVNRASAGVRVRRGAPENSVAMQAAKSVYTIFKRFEVPFRPRAGQTKEGMRDDAAFCLRLVLGLPETQNVDRYLSAVARKK